MILLIKQTAIETAENFIEASFPRCASAVLVGSVVRGEATATSDLDIVIFTTCRESYRYSCIKDGWPIEVFVHNYNSYRAFLQSDYERAKPSLAKMITEGIILKEDGMFKKIKKEAADLLCLGPALWDANTIEMKRYFLTDVLDDLSGCKDRAEGVFIVQTLVERLGEFYLRTKGQLIGDSKWLFRALKTYDPHFASKLTDSLEEYYKKNSKAGLIALTYEVLLPYGGRLFAGFSLGQEKHEGGEE